MGDVEGVQSTLNYILLQSIINYSQVVTLSITTLILIALSGLISGSEVAFFSLQEQDLDDIAEKDSKNARLVHKLFNDPKRLLSTLLIANNLVNICIIIVSQSLLEIFLKFFEITDETIIMIIQVGIITSVLLLLGEIVPKVYATKNNKQLAYMMAKPLDYFGKIPPFSWLALLLTSSTTFIEDKLNKKQADISVEEFNQAIDLTIKDEEDLKDERKILKGLIKFGNISVKQIMKNRMEVTAFDSETSFEELIKTIKESGYSRIPVYNETFDDVKGILYSKDLLEHHHEENFEWNNLLRPAFFVPENKKISNLLKDFQSKRIHLAIVVDEYGGTSGIVTLEDILEEIVGDIRDEYDFDDLNYIKINELEYILDGKTYLVDAARLLNIPENFFEEMEEDVDSIAGLILETTGSFPKFKEEIEYKSLIFTIESLSKKTINRVRITITDESIIEVEA